MPLLCNVLDFQTKFLYKAALLRASNLCLCKVPIFMSVLGLKGSLKIVTGANAYT